jgi:hypothetical protein
VKNFQILTIFVKNFLDIKDFLCKIFRYKGFSDMKKIHIEKSYKKVRTQKRRVSNKKGLKNHIQPNQEQLHNKQQAEETEIESQTSSRNAWSNVRQINGTLA